MEKIQVRPKAFTPATPEGQRLILMKDGCKRLEGVCAEINFFEKIVRPSFGEGSKGWWFWLDKGKYKVVKRFTGEVEDLTQLDFAVLRKFHFGGTRCVVVQYSERLQNFYYCCYRGESPAELARIWEEQKTLTRPTRPFPTEVFTDERKSQAIACIEKKGELFATAVERLFANFYLTSSLWDMDAFVMWQGMLLGLEMKQKYPASDGTFGLNVGLSGLFSHLKGKGIRILHVILTKPIWNEKHFAISLYQRRELAEKSLWLVGAYCPEMLAGGTRQAPGKTSLNSTHDMYYHPVAVSHFRILGPFNHLNRQPIRQFLTGRCRQVRSPADIPRVYL
jgi:hypothetical protein